MFVRAQTAVPIDENVSAAPSLTWSAARQDSLAQDRRAVSETSLQRQSRPLDDVSEPVTIRRTAGTPTAR